MRTSIRLMTSAAHPCGRGGEFWGGDEWMDATDAFFDDYESILTDTDARSSRFVEINEKPEVVDLVDAGVPEAAAERFAGGGWWLTRQTFDDGVGDNAWGFWALIDLAESDELGRAALRVVNVGPLAG